VRSAGACLIQRGRLLTAEVAVTQSGIIQPCRLIPEQPVGCQQYVDPLDTFCELASARAYLWSIGEYDLAEAVDASQAGAVRYGLIDRIGQDAVQAILADAFRPYREVADG